MHLLWVSSSPTPHWMHWPTRMAVSIRNNVDTNECFGFSLAIPEGWQPKPVGADGKATYVAKNVLILMVLERHHEGAFKSQIALTAREAGGSVVTAQHLVSNAVRAQIDGDKNFHSELVRDTYAVDYGETDVCSEPTTSKRLTESRAIWPLSIQNSGASTSGRALVLYRQGNWKWLRVLCREYRFRRTSQIQSAG